MRRRVPRLRTDEEAEAFLESDLSGLDFSQFKPGRLRFDEATGEAPSQAAEKSSSAGSPTYRLFAQAMAERRQILCDYDGRHRELCPIILGHTEGIEVALTYQFAGESNSRPLSPEGDWRCIYLSRVTNIRLRHGPWHSGASHKQHSICVKDVDLDVNPASPYNPKRRLRPS
jgi:hypothetical protein